LCPYVCVCLSTNHVVLRNGLSEPLKERHKDVARELNISDLLQHLNQAHCFCFWVAFSPIDLVRHTNNNTNNTKNNTRTCLYSAVVLRRPIHQVQTRATAPAVATEAATGR